MIGTICSVYERFVAYLCTWHREFAFLPRTVGVDMNGNLQKVWGCMIECRHIPGHGGGDLECRLPGTDTSYVYRGGGAFEHCP